MKKSFLVIFSIFITILTALVAFLLLIVSKNPQTPQTQSVLQETIVEEPVNSTQYLDVNEVLANYEQYVNRKIVVGGLVKTRGGDTIKIYDINGTDAPKWADYITVETYFKTEKPDYFTVDDKILVSGKYTGVMYSKDIVKFYLMADEIKLLN